ncbi:MAG TPA: hypothetical protein PKU88_04760 [Bacillota bacterium]|nr:hypothetical protein [Clostridiaceae bacterium]HNR04979.1 hypothetical protein [Bacillota bacterium]HNT03707.1 hypothetical protein [Bacillota bacterium]HPA54742.1 hypothetical protein [Bacillota bacterium]HPX68628.1 hypothetical protein [Bacillota bacterium]
MVNSKSRKTSIIVLTAIILVLSAVVISAADGVTPGSEQDPIVTQSYVEQKSEQIKYYIDSLIAQETAKLKTELELKEQEIAKLREEIKDAAKAAGKFQVVEMQKGQMLIAGEGAEIIPRSGKFSAIEDAFGGLSDITAAKDLKNGEAVVNNHMLIAARGEGRGLKALADKSFLIIKGTYSLQ